MIEAVTIKNFRIEDVSVFLKYALPCLKQKVIENKITKDQLEFYFSTAFVEGMKAEDMENVFPQAIEELSKIGKDIINKEDIRKYFLYDHDNVVEQNKNMPKKYKEFCKVYPAKIIKKENDIFIVESPVGIKKVYSNLLEDKEAKFITIHRGYACESIDEKEFRELWKIKFFKSI